MKFSFFSICKKFNYNNVNFGVDPPPFFGKSSDLDLIFWKASLSGSKVTAILLKGWILPIGGIASGRVCACSLRSRLVNRPGVAGAVLQTPLSLIKWLSHSSFSLNIFQPLSIPNRKFWQNVHPTCHVSSVMCHVSPVTCHPSHVTCHLSHEKMFFFLTFFIFKKVP